MNTFPPSPFLPRQMPSSNVHEDREMSSKSSFLPLNRVLPCGKK